MRPVARNLPSSVEIACRHFFGGAAAYANGRICISLTGVGLAMKLPAADRDRLLEQGGEPLRYFPTGPVKKQYVVVPQRFHDDEESLMLWARRSIEHVLTLPEPRKNKRRSAST